jgi:hypothetical protein
MIVKTITGEDGTETTVVEKATTAESIQYYLDVERKAAQDEHDLLMKTLGDSGGGGADYSKPPVAPGMEHEYAEAMAQDALNQEAYQAAANGEYPTYFYVNPFTGVVETRNTADGAPPFDSSGFMPDELVPGADGTVNITAEQAAAFGLSGDDTEGGGGGGGGGGGSGFFIAPIFEGYRWKGSPPPKFADQWDNSEGVTDSEGIKPPEDIYKDMLATFSSNRQFLPESDIKEYLDPDEVAAFFNSLPFWEWAVWSETYKCNGCITIKWIETVTTTTTDPVTGVTTTTTEEVEKEILFCPGHIYNVGDVQLDNDLINKVTDQHYNMDRVWDKVWGTPHVDEETGEATETQAEADKRRKDGVKAYKDILKQMIKDLEGAESSEESS